MSCADDKLRNFAAGADMMLLLLVWLWIRVKAWFMHRLRRKFKSRVQGWVRITSIRTQAKPAWVVREIIRLKALMPNAGCRSIANIFNRRYAVSRKMTVGKSFVADTITSASVSDRGLAA